MKNLISYAVAVVCIIFVYNSAFSQTTIITDDPAYTTGESSSVLDVKSNEKGFLSPRMTTAQREDIIDPVDGLIIFNTTTGCLDYFYSNIWHEWCGSPTNFICGTSKVRFTYNGNQVTYGTVVGANDRCWLDRNLGASQVANASNDPDSYGDLFQWGRFAEGHQVRNSAIHNTGLATTSAPNAGNAWDGKFITSGSYPSDWLSPQDDNLWQGVSGINNPCPEGYRLPTEAEWDTERASWSSNNAAGALASPLKLPLAGYRYYGNGSLYTVGTFGFYWSSTVNGINAWRLYFNSSTAGMDNDGRAYGYSVRCLKD